MIHKSHAISSPGPKYANFAAEGTKWLIYKFWIVKVPKAYLVPVEPITSWLFIRSILHWCLFKRSRPMIRSIGWSSMIENVESIKSFSIWICPVWTRPRIFWVPTPSIVEIILLWIIIGDYLRWFIYGIAYLFNFFSRKKSRSLAILTFDDFEPLPQISLTWYTLG